MSFCMSALGFLHFKERSIVEKVTDILIFLFPLFICSVKGVGDLILLLLALSGVYIICRDGKAVFQLPGLKIVSAITLGYFFVLVLAVFFSGAPSEKARFLSRDLHFLFAPLVFIIVARAGTRTSLLLQGIKLGLSVAGLVVLYQYFWQGQFRPSGVMNAGVFGNLMVMMLFLLIASICIKHNKITLYTLSALLLGFSAVVLSGTRGAWLSAIFLLISLLVMCVFLLPSARKISASITAIFCVLLLATYFISDGVQARIDRTVNQLAIWKSGQQAKSSIGIRAEMYVSAVKAIKDMPLMGHGYRSNPKIAEYSHQNYSSIISSYNHLHNAYLTNLLFFGPLGLLALLLVLFVPCFVFFKNITPANKDVAFLGALLCLGYASFGLVNILLGDVFMNAFYVFFMVFFMASMNKNLA